MNYKDYLVHVNPNHDKLGRFSKSSSGGASSSVSVNKSIDTKKKRKSDSSIRGGVRTGMYVAGTIASVMTVVHSLGLDIKAVNAIRRSMAKTVSKGITMTTNTLNSGLGGMTMNDLTKMDLY